MLKNANLYGGTITCQIPSDFMDLSDFIPIPDNQEVFVQHNDDTSDTTSNIYAFSDTVLSFEILEYLKDINDENIGKYLFDDLSKCNEARNTVVYTFNALERVDLGLSQTCKGFLLTGSMEVSKNKFKRADSWTFINVFMYIIRIPQHDVEFLVTYNYPSNINEDKKMEQNSIFDLVAKTLRVVNNKLFSKHLD